MPAVYKKTISYYTWYCTYVPLSIRRTEFLYDECGESSGSCHAHLSTKFRQAQGWL